MRDVFSLGFCGQGIPGVNGEAGEGLLSEYRPQLKMFARRRVKWMPEVMPEVGQGVRDEV